MKNNWKNKLVILASFLLGGIIVLVVVFWGLIQNEKKAYMDDYMATIVIEGVEMDIPNNYKATILEDMGLMYWSEDDFDMLISIEEGNYDELRENMQNQNFDMSELENSRELIPFTEIAIDGRSYLYMLYEDCGDLIMYAYTGVIEEKKDNRIYEIIVFCYDMDNLKPQSPDELVRGCEGKLLVADSIISTSRNTDKEDTPAGELYISDIEYHEIISNISLNTDDDIISQDSLYDVNGNKLVTYDVGDKFFPVGELCDSSKSLKIYYNYDESMYAKVYIDYEEVDAKDYISQGASTWGETDTKVEKISVGNKEFWYYTYERRYNYQGENITEACLVGAMNLSNGCLYCIVLEDSHVDDNMYKVLKKFLDFTEE